MRIFHCDHCDQPVFFENTRCVACGHLLAYLPEFGEIASLEPVGDGQFTSPLPAAAGRRFRLCRNYAEAEICNWALSDRAGASELCQACQLTRVIPHLEPAGNREAWYKLEVAKRRLVYSLIGLGLPVIDKSTDPSGGLAFEFLEDPPDPFAPRVLTGHQDGVIRINIGEADDARREHNRRRLHEPYRTLLGHFRHEIGHYYWDVLIKSSERLDGFRALFGDERRDYAEALRMYYEQGPPSDWQQQFVSAYSTSHPWEDWAETWAHYLHMADTIETAAACGLVLRPRSDNEPTLPGIARSARDATSFDRMIETWFPITYVLNNLNRGMGLPDGYPFVLSGAAIDKLRFVHATIAG